MGNARSPTSASSSYYEGICPSCGKFSPHLNEYTGFCDECSKGIRISTYTNNQTEIYLQEHADHIELLMTKGYQLDAAIQLIADRQIPVCLSCGVLMKQAPRNAVFCRRNPHCRKASRRYVYLYREKGMDKVSALSQVLNELTGE